MTGHDTRVRGVVAAGTTAEHAAATFGQLDDDLVLASYDELEQMIAQPGSRLPATVLVAAGDQMAGVLSTIATFVASREVDATEVAVEIPSGAAGEAAFLDAVRSQDTVVSGVRSVAGRPCAVLGPLGSPAADVVPAVMAAARASRAAGLAHHDVDALRAEIAAVRSELDAARALGSNASRPGHATRPTGPESRSSPARRTGRPRPSARRGEAAATPATRHMRLAHLARALGIGTRRRAALALALAGVTATVGLVLAVALAITSGVVGVLVALTLGAVLVSVLLVLRLLQVSARPPTPPEQSPQVDDLRRDVMKVLRGAQGRLRALESEQRALRECYEHDQRDAVPASDAASGTTEAVGQLVAHQLLAGAVRLPVDLPVGRFAGSGDLLAVLIGLLLRERPSLVVVSGSGVSALVIALAADQHGIPCRVAALEHERRDAAMSRDLLSKHGVADRAEVRFAPLERTSLAGHPTPWYATSAIEDLTDVGLLLVDGPPEATGPDARYPMLPLLAHSLAPTCHVVTADTRRETDRAIVERWHAELPGFELVDLGLQKGALMLRRTGGPA